MSFLITFVATIISFYLFYFLKKRTQKRSQKGECSICGRIFNDKELLIEESLSLCLDDHIYFKSHSWEEIKRVLSDPSHPENSIIIYNEQRQLIKDGTKSFIKVEYVEFEDEVQSIFKLFTPK